MKNPSFVLFFVFVAAATVLRGSPAADACSSSIDTLAVADKHPDFPLSPYVAGHLGVIQPGFARMHLVVAYAWLSGKGLDPAAQKSVLELAVRRLPWVPAPTIVPGMPAAAATPSDPVADWKREHDRILAPATPPASGYTNPQYLTIDNCLEDAFRSARDTLLARERSLGARSAELAGWVAAQDVVFQNCAAPDKKAIPTALPPSASSSARADRDYQIASAYFYANAFDEAQRRYATIASDRASPWAATAAYMGVRVRVRRANVGRDVADAAELRRAVVDADKALADPSRAPIHASLRRYRRYVRGGAEPGALLAEIGAALEGGNLGADTGSFVDDYTTLLDRHEAVLESAHSDVTAFVGAMQQKRTFDFAYARHLASAAGSDAWLVAALALAKNPHDPRVAALVARALAVPAGAPAYATARYHAIRLLAARGASRDELSDLFSQTRRGLGSHVGISTKNAFALLAAHTARDMSTFLREAPIVPAGTSEDLGPVVFDAQKKRAIPEEVAGEMTARFPVARLAEASLASTLPNDVRATVAATAWVRASLLGDRASAARVAPVVGSHNPALRPYVDRVEGAPDANARRLALVHALLSFPEIGPSVDGWATGPAAPVSLASTSFGYFFCPSAAPSSSAAFPFLSAADRETSKREAAAITKLGAGPTWLAREATAAARALPSDPRAPEVLHRAVRATRYGCRDARTTEASRDAFQLLHRAYPTSRWAKATPYYF